MIDLVFAAIAIVIASTHWHALGEHILGGLRAVQCSITKAQREDSLSGDRVLDRLATIRASSYRTVALLMLQFELLFILHGVYGCLREPTTVKGLLSVVPLMAYLVDASMVSGRVELKGKTLTCISLVACSWSWIYCVSAMKSYTSATEHIMGISMNSTMHMLAGLIFLNARMWIPSTIMLSATQLALFVHNFGCGEISAMLLDPC